MNALRAITLTALVTALPAIAAVEPKEAKPRDSALECLSDAKALKGEQRDKALARCDKLASAGGQQNRMKTCNADAKKKELHGDERRAFMSRCLKG